MERNPNPEFRLPFNPYDLRVSGIDAAKRKPRKFFESDELPGKIIRIEDTREVLMRHKNKMEIGEIFETSKTLFSELKERYGISVPSDFYMGSKHDGGEGVYSVVDRIEGETLDKSPASEELSFEVENLYSSLAQYFTDKLIEGGAYLWDINGPTQYIYGSKGKDHSRVHLVDTDMWLGRGEEGIPLSVCWLTAHMGGLESRFRSEFKKARVKVARFLEKASDIPTNQTSKTSLEYTIAFLKNKQSSLPKSAIPPFI